MQFTIFSVQSLVGSFVRSFVHSFEYGIGLLFCGWFYILSFRWAIAYTRHEPNIQCTKKYFLNTNNNEQYLPKRLLLLTTIAFTWEFRINGFEWRILKNVSYHFFTLVSIDERTIIRSLMLKFNGKFKSSENKRNSRRKVTIKATKNASFSWENDASHTKCQSLWNDKTECCQRMFF